MLVSCQRYLRNTYYKRIHRCANPYTVLFDYLYHINAKVFPWIYAIDSQRSVFLSVHFLSPQLLPYNGLELTAFSPYLVACYWLPGAKTQAKGYVKPGQFHLSLKILDESRLTYLNLQKLSEGELRASQIDQIRSSHGEKASYLDCNLLHYRLFQNEIELLIHRGLEALQDLKNEANYQEHLQEITKKSVGLSMDIREKIEQL